MAFRAIISYLFMCFIADTQALVPIESLILGDFSQEYIERQRDPLEYIFQDPPLKGEEGLSKKELDRQSRKVALYRGFYDEGQNLSDYCKSNFKIQYPTIWDRAQVKRSIFSTLQYIGLDLTSRAINQYAKELQFTQEEYENLVENLTGNYCSKNITVISLRQLVKNMKVRYRTELPFLLPTISENRHFSKEIRNITSRRDALKKEFYWSIKLFKSFCSWGNDIDNLRLLPPIVRHPTIMSFIFRQLNSRKLIWDKKSNRVLVDHTPNSVQVYCSNLICRKTNFKAFWRQIPKGAGSDNIEEDFKRLYCSDMRDADYIIKGQEPKILKLIKQTSFDDNNFMLGQFMSLLTGVPDLLLLSNKFSDGKKFFRSGMDRSWLTWALGQNENFNKDLFFEEALSIELVDRRFYYNKFTRKFKVVFDVNLGEFDKSNQIVGKLNTKFTLKLSKKFLAWARDIYVNLTSLEGKEKDFLYSQFRSLITSDIENIRKSFAVAPWKGDLPKLIIDEILEQIANYDGRFYTHRDKGFVDIPVHINFAPMALKYMHYEHQVLENEGFREKRRIELRKLKLRSNAVSI